MQGHGNYYTQRSAILPSIDFDLRSPILYRVTQWVYIYISISLCLFLNKYILLWIDLDLWSGIHLYIYEYAHLYEYTLCHPSTWILDLGSFWCCTHPNTYSHIWTNHAPTFEWDMSHIWMHLSQIHMSHLWMCIICHTHVTHETLWRHACARDMSLSNERTQTGGGFHLRTRVEELTGFEGQVASQVTFYQNNTRPDTMTHDTSAYRYRSLNPSRGCQIIDPTERVSMIEATERLRGCPRAIACLVFGACSRQMSGTCSH